MKKLILSVVMMAALSLNTVNAQTTTQKKCDAKAQCDKTKKECKNDGKCCKAKADANAHSTLDQGKSRKFITDFKILHNDQILTFICVL